jgi:hypothetical protein
VRLRLCVYIKLKIIFLKKYNNFFIINLLKSLKNINFFLILFKVEHTFKNQAITLSNTQVLFL